MKKTFLSLFALASSLQATTLSTAVTADTYLRNDGGTNPTTTWNGDTDNEFLVGSNGSNDTLRGLVRFSIADITSAVAGTGGGNYSNLTINSVTLTLNERRGFAKTGMNMTVHSYGSQFVESAATWLDPDGNGNTATGDATAGGTLGATLGTASLTWNATADSESLAITLDPAAFKTAIQGAPTAGDINMLIRSTVAFNNFVSIKSNNTAGRLATLVVDYTVIPASGPQLTVDPATPQPDYTFPYKSTAASPLTRTIRYKNTGDSGTITIQNVIVTNTTGTAFSAGTTSPALPAALAVGQTIDIPVVASSATGAAFTGSVFIDTDLNVQDKTLPLTASFYQSGQMFGANTSMTSDLGSWGGGSTWVAPGMIGVTADGMARVRGKGDPIVPQSLSSLNQALSIPNNLPDWCLDFRFSPAAPSAYGDYTLAGPPSGDFKDRSFQLVVQSTDAVPGPSLNDTLDDNTLINIAYMPDGITAGGIAGFYLFNQGTWQLIDFNGDGSALALSGSMDVDTDADNTNGVGNGILDATTGDTVNVYRMTLTGSGFGTPSATYSITLNGPGAGFPKTVTGLTGFQGPNITAALPAAFAFITSDNSTASNATSGLCPSFWVDEVGWSAIARPAQRALIFSPPSWVRSLNGATGSHSMTVFNDGTGTLDLNAAITGSSLVSITTPAVLPVSIASGSSQVLTLAYDPSLLSSPNTAGNGGLLTLTSNDFALPSVAYNLTATEVTDANLAANGDFQSDSTGTTFPVAWNTTGTVTNNSGVATLATASTLWQDFGRGPAVTTTDMNNFQVDLQLSVDAFNLNGNRIRLRGTNNSSGEDLLAIRFDGAGFQTADSKTGAIVWQTALATPLAINTNYHIRIIGENFDNVTTRRNRFGISTDGVNYTYGDWLTATHTYNATNVWDFETLTFESGAGVNMLVDNVVVKALASNTFASWMSGFTFAPGADTSATGDADGDSISNLVEQVLGTAPNTPSTGLTQVSSTGTSVTFKHPLNADTASDVTRSYQWSTDLSEWKSTGQSNTGGTTTTITAGAPVSGVVTVTASVTAGTASKLFVRLIANQAP